MQQINCTLYWCLCQNWSKSLWLAPKEWSPFKTKPLTSPTSPRDSSLWPSPLHKRYKNYTETTFKISPIISKLSTIRIISSWMSAIDSTTTVSLNTGSKISNGPITKHRHSPPSFKSASKCTTSSEVPLFLPRPQKWSHCHPLQPRQGKNWHRHHQFYDSHRISAFLRNLPQIIQLQKI